MEQAQFNFEMEKLECAVGAAQTLLMHLFIYFFN